MRCKYNYHDNSRVVLCEFELTLDHYLDKNEAMTPDVIEIQEALIEGVHRMYRKVLNFKELNNWEKTQKESV